LPPVTNATATLVDPPLTPTEVVAILSDARTWPRCPGSGRRHVPDAIAASNDSADLLGIALLRADGAWRLVVDVIGDRLVACITDGRSDPVAAGVGGSLGVVLDAVREQLGAAVREAVAAL
jgi:hypothetical protein